MWGRGDSRQVRQGELQVAAARRTILEGSDCQARWEKLALRTFQLSQQDTVLKEVLARQQIKVTPKNAGNTPVPAPAGTPAKAGTDSPAKSSAKKQK